MPSNNKMNDVDILLQEIALSSQLEEGKEFIRLLLREIYREGTIGTKTLARKLRLPIPTVAAVRKELEKKGLIDRVKKGAIMTEKGIEFVERKLGITFTEKLLCNECSATGLSLPSFAQKLIDKQAEFSNRRPVPRTEIDQAFGKPITAIRRALLMLENGDLEGRNVLLLGDDDLTSLAIAQLKTSAKITVLDIDNRLLELIQEIAKENNFLINCFKLDLQKELPTNILEKFDVVFTDPPYTVTGLELFLSRAIEILKKESGKKIYLAYAHRPPVHQLKVQRIINELGLAITQLIPGFNLYEGAEMHANTTYLAVLSTSENTNSSIKGDYFEKIYTGEINPTKRIYKCSENHLITIGITESIASIEELKTQGCPICGSKKEFILITREKI